jgi:hypothetical protein
MRIGLPLMLVGVLYLSVAQTLKDSASDLGLDYRLQRT